VIIANGRIEVGLCPERGGSLTRVRYAGHDICRRFAGPEAGGWNPLAMACFPLVPFSNRIENGRFEFGGHRGTLSPNMGDHPHAIHGQGWLGRWHPSGEASGIFEMSFNHKGGEWPWPYSAQQRISVNADRFRHDVSITNRSPHPMPAGLGLHPQFTRTPNCSLQAKVQQVWLTTEDGIPTERVEVPQEWSLAGGKPISELRIDHCFAGWNHTARIVWPEFGTAMTITADSLFDHLVVFTPGDEDFFCVEPVSHMPNAINQTDPLGAGLVYLQPGKELRAGVTYLFEDI